jgi:hypothetical protein
MKSLKYIFLFFITVLFFSSCSEVLEEIPKDRLTSELFYKTRADAVAAVNSIYQPIRTTACMGQFYNAQQDVMSDYSTGRGSYIPVGNYQGLDATNIGRTSGMWVQFYASINYANIAIKNIPAIQMSATDQNALIAEARFMRAFCYYQLVRNWGGVPLRLEPTVTDEQIPAPRATADAVYNAIIDDLKAAETSLPDASAQAGKPNKLAASALLADVYLTRENWALARDKAEQVISSGKYALIEITKADDFDKIFGAGASNTSEEVFHLKYNNQNGNGWPFFLLWDRTVFAPYGAFVLFSVPTNPFIRDWDAKDLRRQFGIFSTYVNRTTGVTETLPASTPILYSKYRDPGAPTNANFANDYPYLRYSEILLIYAEASSQAANGPTSLAIERLNMIKRRAYGFPSKVASSVDFPATGWTATSFRDAVIQERAYEQFMEGKRWLDLKRTGKAAEKILANKNLTIRQAHYLWPIPQQEIDTNPALSQKDQNPGY